LACCITLVVGIVLVTQDGSLRTDAILSALGLNLIASVIFAVVFTVLSNRVQERSLEENISDRLTSLIDDLRQDVGEANRVFMPIATYPALDPIDGYGDPFNRDMTRSLEQTGFYAFRGPSPRYAAARLCRSHHYPQQVKVAVVSPGDDRAIGRRASDRLHWARSRGKTLDILKAELRDELVMSVVALFDYRQICPVELLYIEDTAVYRYEMFDDALYLSWFHGPHSAGREMPESYRFASESFFYKALRLDLNRRFEISSHRVLFDGSQTDLALMQHLESVTAREVTEADLASWRRRYANYTADFVAYLDRVYLAL
jgi:hypothetical protein